MVRSWLRLGPAGCPRTRRSAVPASPGPRAHLRWLRTEGEWTVDSRGGPGCRCSCLPGGPCRPVWVRMQSKDKRFHFPQHEVSCTGQVRRADSVYPLDCRVTLTVHGKRAPIHRLVCHFFQGPAPSADLVVEHADRNPDNNRAPNLRWVNRSRFLHSGAIRPLRGKPVTAVDEHGFAVASFLSGVEACSWLHCQTGLSPRYLEQLLPHAANTDRPLGYWWWVYALTRHEAATQYFDLRGEEWREFRGFRVSSYGRVCGWSGRLLVQRDCNRHPVVTYSGKTWRVSRLVLSAFGGEAPQRKTVVDHVDGNPSNNAAANLRWVAMGDLLRKPERVQYMRDHPSNGKGVEAVLESTGKAVFVSYSAAARTLGVSIGKVKKAARNGAALTTCLGLATLRPVGT
mmetsp:Transcript_29383/g.75176  ORF Transcript_29383/g.75176 Transcript_29383/m.75176 type:complete len:399 (+) Transcript_29383:75-1271(+)